MSKLQDNYRELAMSVGLQFDLARNVLYGQKGGFEFLIYAPDSRYPYMLAIQTTARSVTGAELDKDQKKELVKSMSKIASVNQKGNTITFQQAGIGNQEKLKAALTESLSGIAVGLQAKGYNPCCSMCNQNRETAAFLVGSGYLHLCPDCETRLRSNMQMSAQAKEQQSENVVGGIIGALIGSLLGVLCIILLSRMGYVAALSGVAMAFGVLKGYEMLGKKLTKKGIVICVIIMLFMTYVGDRMDWAILAAMEYGENLLDCYRAIPAFLAEGYIEMGDYILNLVMLYLFLLLGAVPSIISSVKDQKVANQMVRIGNYYTTSNDPNNQWNMNG